MHQSYPFTQVTRIPPNGTIFNGNEVTELEDLTPTETSDDDTEMTAEKTTTSRSIRRQVFLSLLLCIASVLIIGLAAVIAVSLSQKMNPSDSQSISCTPSCLNSATCISNNVCQCLSGYNGSLCETAICNQSCVNGACSSPNTCTCSSGWNGSTCNSAICTSSCVNGACSSPNTCTCNSGWNGSTCNSAICSSSCVNGACSSPNTCTCNSGWNGSTCNSAICTSPCVNGACSSPNTCTCNSGWNGSTCNSAICSPSCLNNGNCTAPNTCTCTSGYNGSICQYPVCNPSCINGGVCIATNSCQCTTDVWTGPYCQTPVRIFWPFDNNLADFYNNYPGVGINGPTYSSPGINGYGECLLLNAAANQSVTVYSPPFLNMALTSFSLVAWVNARSFHNTNVNGSYSDNAIFGQFDNNTLDHSLHIIVRNQKIYLGFFSDDIQGNITLYPGFWYHMAYIYDYSTLTQYVYVNGVLDVSGSPKGPYQGTKGDLTIGTNGVNAGVNYWDGCIDQVAYFARAKNATEVLSDATLTVDFSFDNTLIDSGPLGINGTGANYSYSSPGRLNVSLALLNNQSYVRATGLVLLGTSGQAYSFSIWIKPTVITVGTIIHVSRLATGLGWCIPMLGFTSAGAIGVQGWNSGTVGITGPTATTNVWTHVAVTYSSTNGLRLWINGTQYGSASIAYSYTAAGVPVILTIGSSLSGTGVCAAGLINVGQYSGYMDEFQLYSRELSASDVLTLANP